MDLSAPRYLQAVSEFNQGNLTLAQATLQQTLQENPRDGRSWELLGLVHFAERQWESCRECLEMAESLSGLSLIGQVSLAECYWAAGLAPCARQRYRSLAQMVPQLASERISIPMLSRMVIGLSRSGEFQAALELSRQAAQANPQCEQARFAVAHYMTKAGYPAEFVRPVVQRAIDLNPGRFFYRVALASLHCKLRDYEQAYLTVADASSAELRTISCACCLRRLAAIYSQHQDQRRAELCLSALEAIPDKQPDRHDF